VEAISSTTAALWLSLSCPLNLGCIHTYLSVSCDLCAPCAFATTKSTTIGQDDDEDTRPQRKTIKAWTPITGTVVDSNSYHYKDMPSLFDDDEL